MAAMRFDTVLFDLDGTLIDSGALILSSFRHATRTVLGRELAEDVLMANVGGHGIHRQMAEFDPDRVDDLVQAYRDHNVEVYRRVRTFAGIEPVLTRLKEQGRRLGVVTVKSRPTVELTFEILPLRQFFDEVITGDDVHEHKPDPEALLLAVERLVAHVERAAYVGDSPFDIQAAKAGGLAAVAVAWGGIHTRERLAAEQPDALVERPEELLRVL